MQLNLLQAKHENQFFNNKKNQFIYMTIKFLVPQFISR